MESSATPDPDNQPVLGSAPIKRNRWRVERRTVSAVAARCQCTADSMPSAPSSAEVGENRRSLETSRRGVYAIGDIRSGSIKRVAAAVGEGAQVVAALHAYLSPPHAVQTTPAAAEAASTNRHLP